MESPEIQRMRERCNKLYVLPNIRCFRSTNDGVVSVPGLENAEFDPVAPVVQGLRPTRVGNVRVERELRPNRMHGGSSSIVHSYGQGGSGFSFSIGCAVDVLHLIDQVVLERRVGNFDVEMYRSNL